MLLDYSFFKTESFVAVYLMGTYVFSLSFLFSKMNHGVLVSIYSFGFLLMGWSVIPSTVAIENYWFQNPPPWFTSYFTLFALASFIFIDAYKTKFSVFTAKHFVRNAILVIFSLIITYLHGLTFVDDFDSLIWIKWSAIMIFGGLIALYLFHKFSGLTLDSLTSHVAILLILSLVVGFFELSGAPFVVNNYRGHFEARASSLYNNPNWYAIYISPLIFYAFQLTQKGVQSKSDLIGSFLIISLISANFVLSGSRSTVSVVVCFILLLIFSLLMVGLYKIAQRICFIFIFGGVSGVCLGYIFAQLFGVADKYLALNNRLFLWPFYIVNDLDAQLSVVGRAFWSQGRVSDSVYVKTYFEHPALFALIITLLLLVFFRFFYALKRQEDFNVVIATVLLLFLFALAAIGQVFWAFPVCIAIFSAVGISLRPLITGMSFSFFRKVRG